MFSDLRMCTMAKRSTATPQPYLVFVFLLLFSLSDFYGVLDELLLCLLPKFLPRA